MARKWSRHSCCSPLLYYISAYLTLNVHVWSFAMNLAFRSWSYKLWKDAYYKKIRTQVEEDSFFDHPPDECVDRLKLCRTWSLTQVCGEIKGLKESCCKSCKELDQTNGAMF